MIEIRPVTPAIGAEISGVDFSRPLSPVILDQIYQALIDHLVIFIRNVEISPRAHLEFARSFGEIDEPHQLYPHVEGFENIMLLENDEDRPPDTNSWHTDLTYKIEQPFASVLIARQVPDCGGDTLWSSNYAAYDRLPSGMKLDLEELEAIHDYGDFRNSFLGDTESQSTEERLNQSIARFGHHVRPLIDIHPVSGLRFLNFNEAFVAQIAGMTTGQSDSLKSWLAYHMNHPEDQMRWRWSNNDLAMWDNRVTMHYATADYLPAYRRMNRITVVKDRRVNESHRLSA